MKKIILLTLMLTIALGLFAQKGKSLQANVLYGSKIESVGFGVAFNWTKSEKTEFTPSINLYLPKDGINVKEINFDYHRLIGIQDRIKVFPIIGLGIAVWENDYSDNATKMGLNLGLGGRYCII